MGPLFLTGGTGFIGRRLLQQFPAHLLSQVRCLARSAERVPGGRSGPEVVLGDLDHPAPWQTRLEGVETVLHLAAAAGKASARTFHRVNVEGTRALLEVARTAGVRRFIFVSSVAAGFSDQRFYPYATSKLAAERLVTDSGLDALIVRPTMVLGPGSAVLKGLATLAGAPVGIRFGRGAEPVQPVHVADVADFLLAALELGSFPSAPVGLGGPETVPLEELLRRLRVRLRGTAGPFLRVPLTPVRWCLALMEPLLLPVLPLTAGQLASFANPGTVPPEPWPALVRRPHRDIATMLEQVP